MVVQSGHYDPRDILDRDACPKPDRTPVRRGASVRRSNVRFRVATAVRHYRASLVPARDGCQFADSPWNPAPPPSGISLPGCSPIPRSSCSLVLEQRHLQERPGACSSAPIGDGLSFKHRFRCITLCLALYIGAGIGMPMPPEKLEALLHQMSRPAIAHKLRQEDDDDGLAKHLRP